MNQEETENMNRPITSNEIDSVIIKLPQNKSPRPGSFTGEFYKTFKEELGPSQIIPKKLKRKEHLQTHSMVD